MISVPRMTEEPTPTHHAAGHGERLIETNASTTTHSKQTAGVDTSSFGGSIASGSR